VLTLLILPMLGVNGATMGIAALLAGFTVEAAVVWWGVRGHQLVRAQRIKSELAPQNSPLDRFQPK
jgi:hypothetical protein